jgi:MraZ protein
MVRLGGGFVGASLWFLSGIVSGTIVALFLSTHINRIDKKGRVSVPAGFRAALAGQSFQGIVMMRSGAHAALEGFGWDMMHELSARLDNFDIFSDAQDDLATAIFGESVPLPFDGDGRVVLPGELIAHAGLSEQAAFVGMGRKFQIWEPGALSTRREQARSAVADKGLTLPAGQSSGGQS